MKAFRILTLALLTSLAASAFSQTKEECIAFGLLTSRSGLPRELAGQLAADCAAKLLGLKRFIVLPKAEADRRFGSQGIFIPGEVNPRSAANLAPATGAAWYIVPMLFAEKDGSLSLSLLLDDINPATRWVSNPSAIMAKGEQNFSALSAALARLVAVIDDPAQDKPAR